MVERLPFLTRVTGSFVFFHLLQAGIRCYLHKCSHSAMASDLLCVCVNMIYLVSTKGGVKVTVSIPFGFCSPRSVVKFSPVYILIPGSHEGNRSSHRTRTKALVSWGLLPGLYSKYSSFLSFCDRFSCLAFFFFIYFN